LLETLDRKLIFGVSDFFSGDTIMTLNAINSDTKVGSNFTGTECIVEELPDNFVILEEDYVDSPKAINDEDIKKESRSLTKTKGYKVNIGSGVKSLDVYLSSNDRNTSLKLTAYNPSGKKIGTKSGNGELAYNLKANGGGSMEKGDWGFKVRGESVTFKAYAHK